MSSIIKSSQVNYIKQDANHDTRLFTGENLGDEDRDLSKEDLDELQKEQEELLISARKDAEYIIKSAKEEAEKIKSDSLETAKKEAEDLKEESSIRGYKEGQSDGYSKGHEEGREEGYDQGKEESQALIEEANEIKREYLNEKERVLNSIEEDVIKLVVDITKKILNQKIEEDDEAIIDLVFKGLATLNSKEDIRIRVSKEDFDKVEESKERILSKVSLIENLKVDVDSTLKKGDCIIESAKGNVDVSIDTQMKNVEEELNDLLDSE